MWEIFNELYREYCLARLLEMRKLELALTSGGEHRRCLGLPSSDPQRERA